MQTSTDETIAALATPPGRGGIGIVRVSGPLVRQIAAAVLGRLPEPRYAQAGRFHESDGSTIDTGLALFFPAPRSFTGEDTLELHGHGGPVVCDMLLARVLALGARAARPGEFSERAFLNDKLDLAQAEAVADLIDSGSAAAARAAMRSLQGEFSSRVRALNEAVTTLRVYVESAIDFPDEEIDYLSGNEVRDRADDLLGRFDELARAARQGCLLQEGMTVVLAGRPNVGKSTLLNRLAGREAAIVTAVPGTTRDVLRERIDIDGLPLHVIDTAGLRDTDDVIEKEGVRRSREQIAQADRVLLIVDAADPQSDDESRRLLDESARDVPLTIVRNKIDLTGEQAGVEQRNGSALLRISAATGAGLEELRAHLEACVGYRSGDAGLLTARRRHLDALATARAHVEAGRAELLASAAGDLLAEELRLAQRALGEITGEVTSDALLGRIFASFCIGK
ncbi:MAG: tRNA uridine-5-carboxymethylaminomethyl(34) synthesis GTPase MnmE [Gammaproteobacteria bacterium]|nr:tRNA uridine-5-carboxymethylaminomethyl(34) synthesis GTPase MnmE [Gammaproteobacteria bacterium]